MTMEEQPAVPRGLLSNYKFINYNFEGVEKQAVWLPLSNGMRLNLTVPVNELNADWQRWSVRMLVIYVVLLIFFIVVIRIAIGRLFPDR
jgi:hypothetical protein